MIKRIQGGQFPDSNYDPYEDYIDFFTYEKMVTPLSAAPEPKRRFIPSKHEHKRIMKMVRAIRKGWIKIGAEKIEAPEFFDIWSTANEEENSAERRRRMLHITAPKVSSGVSTVIVAGLVTSW